MSRVRAQLSAACGLVLAAPAVALACPVCFNAKDDAARVAFLGTTVFLTALPLLLIGGVIMWLARRAAAPEPPTVEPEDGLAPKTGTDPDAVTGAHPVTTRG